MRILATRWTPTDADRAAVAALRRADARLDAIVRRAGEFTPQIIRDPYTALLLSIVHQQLSMKAAATISGRVVDLCPRRRPTPAALLAIRAPRLRRAGLSAQKVKYVRDLSERFAERELTAAKLRKLDDEGVIAAVTCVHGIGRWTAEMLLIFCLQRPDVWPIDDLGLRKAVQRLVGSAEMLGAQDMTAIAETWRPFRSYATWYLWRSLESPPEEKSSARAGA